MALSVTDSSRGERGDVGDVAARSPNSENNRISLRRWTISEPERTET